MQIVDGKFASFEDDPKLLTLPEGLILVPGFIDEHMHGANGSDVMDGTTEALENISISILQDGVTSFLATTMTMSKDKIKKALTNFAKYKQDPHAGSQVLGIHLEGPFISQKFKGAQNESDIQQLSVDLLDEFNKLSENNIRIVTFAYENNGSEFLQYLINHHIVASIGHSDCNSHLAFQGIKEGISCATHTFNAMRGIHHRDVGVTGAVLLDESVNCELICDLNHVSSDAIKLLYRLKGDKKVILITDSMEARFFRKWYL